MLSEIQVAVDVGSTRHRVAIGAPDGKLLAEFDIPHTPAGFGELSDGGPCRLHWGSGEHSISYFRLRVGAGMHFNNIALQGLVSSSPASAIERAELANLLLEERVSSDRQSSYETHVTAKSPSVWDTWRAVHESYVVHFVRGGNGKDPATFQGGEPAVCAPAPEANQFVLRLEELNAVLVKEGFLDDERDPNPVKTEEAAARINNLITEWKKGKATAAPKPRGRSLADLGRLTGRDATFNPARIQAH